MIKRHGPKSMQLRCGIRVNQHPTAVFAAAETNL